MRGAALAHDSFPSVPHTDKLRDFIGFLQPRTVRYGSVSKTSIPLTLSRFALNLYDSGTIPRFGGGSGRFGVKVPNSTHLFETFRPELDRLRGETRGIA